MPTVDLAAGRIHYTERGSGPAVVLLHGLLINHTVWDEVLDLLPEGFRYVLPDLPLGAHPEPVQAGADLSLRGLNQLIAEFLAALDLRDVTLVHSDWGGGLFLTAYGLDERVGSLIVLPCEAYDNFPPGLPGRTATLAARLPGGVVLALRQLRVGWLRRTPLLFGWMTRRGLSDEMVRGWTEPGLRDPAIRRDVLGYLRTYLRGEVDDHMLIAHTEALRRFRGPALILWSSDDRVMPLAHARALAESMPDARLRVVDDAAVLSMIDRPEAVAAEMGAFLVETVARR
ncbi:MAG TPA: alpha/beta hydrolase [Nocardia sp.]|uniref:alpha/beta fold hydrolase n=1 Tax=Nocardia TaxID=1817 RepID=UPI0024578AEB|nr:MULTISPECIES: alpha/beta hydrolase [Nocardia]HLS78224.1 alpha/beta hydrolase [Nocardia sp.]